MNDWHDKVVEMYKDGCGTCYLAEYYSVNRSTIQRILISKNIKLRKKTPNIKNIYNIKYFDKYSEGSCYWAGFIAADGCIRSDRDALEIGLAKVDHEHLKKFLSAIDSERKIYEEKKAYRLSIPGTWFPSSLKKKYNITTRKSLTLQFPDKIPNKYLKDFIRGYFDGDGSLCESGIISISFIGTYNFLDSIRKIFYDKIEIKMRTKNKLYPKVCSIPNNKAYSLCYSGNNAIKILDWMHNTKTTNYLDRKYKLYLLLREKYKHLLKG